MKKAFGGFVVVMLVAGFVVNLPDIMRYIRIKTM
jgi:hypothetical protein